MYRSRQFTAKEQRFIDEFIAAGKMQRIPEGVGGIEPTPRVRRPVKIEEAEHVG